MRGNFAVCCALSGAYDWAQTTLDAHRKDKRDKVYTQSQLDKAKTHDDLWNAAQVSKANYFTYQSYSCVANLVWSKVELQGAHAAFAAV